MGFVAVAACSFVAPSSSSITIAQKSPPPAKDSGTEELERIETLQQWAETEIDAARKRKRGNERGEREREGGEKVAAGTC